MAASDTSGLFFYFHVFLSTGSWDKRLGCLPLQWVISSPLLSSPPVSQQHYTSTEASQCHITTRSYHPKNLYRPSVSRDVSIFFSAVKTRAGCYCKAPFLVSNPLLQFSQWRLHLSLTALALPCLALPRCSFYLRTNTIRPEMIQHAGRQGGRQAGGLRSCCVFTSGT